MSENRFIEIFSFLYVSEQYNLEELDEEELGYLYEKLIHFFTKNKK